jgi:23S rRNA (cytosine1962-C5)-methyltransferase
MTPACRPACRIVLKPGRDKAVRDGHPWLFSGAIERVEGPPDAPLAQVWDSRGHLLGVGFHSPTSQIRVRLVAGEEISPAFFSQRIAEALALRDAVVPAETTGYRVINAEGDGLPGWTVDRFGDILVSQVTAAGLEALREDAYAALAAALPDLGILQSNRVPARALEGLPEEDETIAGAVPEQASFTECGLRFTADLTAGQKTGFYCDQRESRRLTERLATGQSVLDLFAHTGAFGVYSLRGGAARVTPVESSAKSIERGKHHLEINGFAPERAEWVKANVFHDLRERQETYGLVICDPPPLVRKRGDLDAAARAYKDLNRLAFGRVAPGGFLLTFSCSGAMDTKLFRQILFAAAVEARVRVSLLQPLAAAPDHPVAITHPQGEYLKGWWAVVTGRL